MKSYTVLGRLPFRGYRPGETFEADLPAGLEKRAIARGSIRVEKTGSEKKRRGGRRKATASKAPQAPATTPAEAPAPATDEQPTTPAEGDGDGKTNTPDASGSDE